MEAQRYPDDFNGVIAGAAALNFQVQNALHHAWLARANEGASLQTSRNHPCEVRLRYFKASPSSRHSRDRTCDT
ncbi:hypothetical protein PS833_02922 [Pseudomonas fluorescens]|uniref:Uncharacterized protein n=1 Tax=Pseudomonas fluorescens TaxID=294 RepID=A0A5E7D8P7_PSEFL|nr:hypothetical protein PS833_02922 [Pseudomonas fluorescens]